MRRTCNQTRYYEVALLLLFGLTVNSVQVGKPTVRTFDITFTEEIPIIQIWDSRSIRGGITMRRIHLFLILIFVFSAIFIVAAPAHSWHHGEAEVKEEVSPGMEIIQIGNGRYLRPKGAKIGKRAGVITFEGPGEYAVRRLSDFEERLAATEKEIERLKRVLGKKKRE